MKTAFRFILTVQLFFSGIFISRSQESSEFYFSKKDYNAKLDTISFKEFVNGGNPVSFIEPKINNKIDSILTALRVKYPGSIKDSLQYLVLYSNSLNRYLWNDSSDPNNQISFTKIDYKFGYLIFYFSHSNGEEYILFNPQNKILKSVKGYPVFIDEKKVYTIGSYDGEYYFQYKGLKTESQILFQSNIWAMNGFYYANKKFYFEFIKGDKKKWFRMTVY